jgi:hypothetical protein
MISATKPVYRSSGQRGFTRSVSDDARHVTACWFGRSACRWGDLLAEVKAGQHRSAFLANRVQGIRIEP